MSCNPPPLCDFTLKWSNFFSIGRISGLEKHKLCVIQRPFWTFCEMSKFGLKFHSLGEQMNFCHFFSFWSGNRQLKQVNFSDTTVKKKELFFFVFLHYDVNKKLRILQKKVSISRNL